MKSGGKLPRRAAVFCQACRQYVGVADYRDEIPAVANNHRPRCKAPPHRKHRAAFDIHYHPPGEGIQCP